MYIIAIAWLYVALLMALTEPSIVGGILSFVFYGLLPCALALWLLGTPQRKRLKRQQQTLAHPHASAQPNLGEPNRPDTERD